MNCQRLGLLMMLVISLLTGCGQRAALQTGTLSDSVRVLASLNEQLREWKGAPYRYGGIEKNGVDCSGFVYRTFYDKFNIALPRTTREQTSLGIAVARKNLMPGDLVFFKTGSGNDGLHVGIYHTKQQFIHASTSKGVIKSSLNNRYWDRVYWQARRL